MRATITVTVLMNLLMFPYQHMVPVISRDVLNVGPGPMGVLMAGADLGAMIGAVLVASATNIRHHVLVVHWRVDYLLCDSVAICRFPVVLTVPSGTHPAGPWNGRVQHNAGVHRDVRRPEGREGQGTRSGEPGNWYQPNRGADRRGSRRLAGSWFCSGPQCCGRPVMYGAGRDSVARPAKANDPRQWYCARLVGCCGY